LPKFDPEKFINERVGQIREIVGDARALIAVSGGVDSTTCAALTHVAIGDNLLCVILDDAFMREGEPERVAQLLSQPPLDLPVKILDVRKRFLTALKGLTDAEEKRKAFRETFYRTLGETAEKGKFRHLVQGTIQADIDETTGGVKTQHNVLSQVGINPVERYGFQIIEPLLTLYKPQVREVARFLKVPAEMSERQPFPGPGLSVRVVGEVRADKLEALQKATAIAEESLAEHQPSQYFAAILDNKEVSDYPRLRKIKERMSRFLNVPSRNVSLSVFHDKATGVRSGKRRYGDIAAMKVVTEDRNIFQPPIKSLVALQEEVLRENRPFTRALYAIQEKTVRKPYVVALRAVQTRDFLSARVSEIPWSTLNAAAEKILAACSNVSNVYYDVTPKPPATIEME
jgi:GMP synthase (glutamine-hydrolysing)